MKSGLLRYEEKVGRLLWEEACVFPCATISRWRNEFDMSVSQIQAGGPKRRKLNTEDVPCSSSSSTCGVLAN